MSIEAMKQALEALVWIEPCDRTKAQEEAITSLRQAIKDHAMYELQRLGQEIEAQTQEQMLDLMTFGVSWSKDGKRIDPSEVYLEQEAEQDGQCKHCTTGCVACDARRQSNVLS